MRTVSPSRIGLGFLLCFLLFGQMPIGSSSHLYAQEPTTGQGNILYLPSVSGGNFAQTQSQSRQFVWRLSQDAFGSSVTRAGLSAFGQEWVERERTKCDAPENANVFSAEQQEYCRMLKYTLDGKFTTAEIESIKANGGIIMAVAETVTRIPPEDLGVVEPSSMPNAIHPDTGDVLTVITEKPWWSQNVYHRAFAGPPNWGPTYSKVRLWVARLDGNAVMAYNEPATFYNTDNASVSKYVPCCFQGGTATTQAWFTSHAGREIYAGYAPLNLW